MKPAKLGTIVLAAAALVATNAFAQMRHDERPHGMNKPAQANERTGAYATPGRHDERPHGPAPKKQVQPVQKPAPIPAPEPAKG